MEYKYVPLWALLPALSNRETAKRYLKEGEKSLGRPLTKKEIAYLEDVIRQGDRVEEFLRKLGYFEEGPRGILLRKKGIITSSDKEAEELLRRFKDE